MSGSNYTLTCPKCKTVNPVRGKAMTLAMTCSACGIFFRQGTWNPVATNFTHTEEPALTVGTKGKIENTVYEVMGFVVKKETRYKYSWREYLLFNPYQGYAFLSEYNGHWNFIWPVEEDPKRGLDNSEFYEGEHYYRLFQKYQAQVIYARGEFFFDVVDITETTSNAEYIAPPFLYSIETSEDSILWCKGEYLTPHEVADAFKIAVNKLPPKQGRGYTQPITSSFSGQGLVRLSIIVVFIVLFIQFFLSISADEKVAYQGSFNKDELKEQKVFITPSFSLEGGTKSVELDILAPVSNDWFFGEFSLVNDNDGTEYNFTKDIEYYYGYEDGESWSEGSTRGQAFLSKIPGGQYHINIYPEFGSTSKELYITVTRDVPTLSNFFITSLALALFPVVFFIRRRILEERRWSESDYSPYASSED